MLDLTLATTFEAGTNLKGSVAGANWLFLLPSLELGWVICVGTPAPSALQMVSRFANQVDVICEDEIKRKRLSDVPIYRDNPTINLASLDGQMKLGHADSTVDLVWIADKGGMKQLANSATLISELRRVLRLEGLIYADSGWLSNQYTKLNGRSDLFAHLGVPQRLWLTPFIGEMQTAVPVQDEETIKRFLKEGIYSQTLGYSYSTFSALKRLANGKRANLDKNTPSDPRAFAKRKGGHTSLRLTMLSLGKAFIPALQRAEQLFVTQFPALRRYGAFLAGNKSELTTQPPLYLRSIARKAGFDIDNCHWGLSARGAYNTRKVLIFLYDPKSNVSTDRSPDLVAKIVRDPSLNYRLENEYRALKQLSKTDFSHRGNAPQAAFIGFHRGLAVVGETMIQGSPFLKRTSATAECQYARLATDWIIDLGAETANWTAASSADVAGVLAKLLARFTELYQPSEPIYNFLSRQIATFGQAEDAFPLVFQHGDPGTWNAMITLDGHVTYLDWEAAEPEGMPLWDLFYFQRSYCMVVARRNGVHDRQTALSRGFLRATPFNRQLISSTKKYCMKIGLASRLVEPLFYTCWMQRALKEAASLSPARLDNGHYLKLLKLFIENSHSETLSQLFLSGLESSASDRGVSVDETVALIRS
jgi:hypothetical protein